MTRGAIQLSDVNVNEFSELVNIDRHIYIWITTVTKALRIRKQSSGPHDPSHNRELWIMIMKNNEHKPDQLKLEKELK